MTTVQDILNRRVEFIDMPPLFDAAILEDNDMPDQNDPMVWNTNEIHYHEWLEGINIEAVPGPRGIIYRVRIFRRNGRLSERMLVAGVDHYLSDIFTRGLDPEANGDPWPHPGETIPAHQRVQMTPTPGAPPPFTPVTDPPPPTDLERRYAQLNAEVAMMEHERDVRRLQNELNEQQAARLRERAERWAERFDREPPIIFRRPAENLEPGFPPQFPEGAGEVIARPTGAVQPEMIQADPLDQWIQRHQVTAAPEPQMEVAPNPSRHHRLGGIGANGQVGG